MSKEEIKFQCLNLALNTINTALKAGDRTKIEMPRDVIRIAAKYYKFIKGEK